ncbi:MAG: hypothetical protein JW843_08980 [Candidatus Aminicenantes bacterium]|nr:hypothetical protein [Candidatus Aminicenantes bacterium]
MIDLEGEKKTGPPWKVRLAIIAFIFVVFAGGFFFTENRKEGRVVGLITMFFGGCALGLVKKRRDGGCKNPGLSKILEGLALGSMFAPHLWLLREGRAADMLSVHPHESIVIPAMILVLYYLFLKYW